MFDYSEDKVSDNIARSMNILMLVLFLPVLFCVMFIGTKMDYFEEVKPTILVPSVLLTLIASAAMGIALWLLHLGRKIRLSNHAARYMSFGLVVLFIGFFFFCLMLSKETVFDMAVDQGIVRRTAIEVAQGVPLGYRFEFSIDYNNIPITYILGRLYQAAENLTWFQHDQEYLWVIVGCLSVTVGGFCSCEIVKRLTRNPIAVLMTFGLYLLVAGFCPWKYIPYTDSYGIPFPVLCLLLYLYGRDCRHIVGKMLLYFFACLSGVVGGFIKPSAYLAVLAMLGLAGVDFLLAIINWIRDRKADSEQKKRKSRLYLAGFSLFAILLCLCVLYRGSEVYTGHIIDEMGLKYNEELESTLQYYFFSSLNETTTGSFTIEDYGVFGEFQFSKADRNAACMQRAWERIRQRGLVGSIYFYLKKLVKSFNDGTFAWTDVLYYEPFPENLTHDTAAADYLRSLFMPGGSRQVWYDTLAELVWIFILMGVPGVTLTKNRRAHYMVFVILFIGILVYLMLFESGARYLYIFLPVITAMSACGTDLAGIAIGKIHSSRKAAVSSAEN